MIERCEISRDHGVTWEVVRRDERGHILVEDTAPMPLHLLFRIDGQDAIPFDGYGLKGFFLPPPSLAALYGREG